MAENNKKSINLLPEFLRTDKNSKFLSSTLDPLIQTPQLERIDSFVGSVITPNYNPSTDFYLQEDLPLRKNYALQPGLVFKNQTNEITDVVGYDDLINEISTQGGNTDNLDRLFRSKFYAYDPLICWDKLINFTQYYWLPDGPEAIEINDESLDVDTDIIEQVSYTMPNGYELSNGMKIVFSDNVSPASYRGKEYIVEGVGCCIKLVDFSLLDVNEPLAKFYDETFDTDIFDTLPFDGSRRLPIDPEYITINKASIDLNPWTRYNRWFHRRIIEITAEIKNIPPVLKESARAKRPIIEFRPNIQLYNFGKFGIKNVELIDTDTENAFLSVDGTPGYHIDGVLLEQGFRVIFNADKDENVRGKIYTVNFDHTSGTSILRLVEVTTPETNNLDSIAINKGTKYFGTSWYFDSETKVWKFAQQHTKLNEPPLFDLFDKCAESYSKDKEISDFTGTKIFGYDVGTGKADTVLGFPLKYQNSLGTGSYLFKNYFMTESFSVTTNNQTTRVPTGSTFLLLNLNQNTFALSNVWTATEEYEIPIVEIQTTPISTSTIKINSLTRPVSTATTVAAYSYSNNEFMKLDTTSSFVTPDLFVNFASDLVENQTVVLKLYSDQKPNENGYYETPLSLTNNPLNGPIEDFTLGELEDHLKTMTSRDPNYYYDPQTRSSNLRDLCGFSKYGSRLIINANPISFSQIFLGKKEHNVVDATRQVGEHYIQFKANLLRQSLLLDGRTSPAESLDLLLKEVNKNKDYKSPYYRSDMLGYGDDKVVRSYTVENIETIEYPLGFDFSPNQLNFQSVIIYHTRGTTTNQLVLCKDYIFDCTNDQIVILFPLEVDDVIEIHYYRDTLGCFVPPTPSKLGLYPSFEPEIYTDTSYVEPVLVIRGHDGSITRTYGDYRDGILLEFEKRIYNNIKVEYHREMFDIAAVIPGAFRKNKYTLDDFNSIINKDFLRWAGVYNIDVISNNTYDSGNPFTWNYKGSNDVVFGNDISGFWRGIYKFFYDTDEPQNKPWEMLGISIKPTWWDTTYGFAPYKSTYTQMWEDLEAGYARGDEKYYLDFARPGLSVIIPVDSNGTLKNPSEFLVSPNGYLDQISKWKFGDQGPAESAWRRSSYWPFAVNAAAALLDPTTYLSRQYDTSRIGLNILDQVSYFDDLYLSPKKLKIDGYNNEQTSGFSVFVVEVGKNKNQNYINELYQDLAYFDTNLFQKLGGFASKEKLQLSIDSIDPVSRSPGVILPPEDYSLILNVSNPVKSARISGIIVQKSDGNFIVKGYDKQEPYFNILMPVKTAISGTVKVGGVSESFVEWASAGDIGYKGLSSIDTTSASSTTSKYYKAGQIVRYENKFYRVKVNHVAQQTFDIAFFYLLPELPIKGGAVVQKPAQFEKVVTQIPYGTEFSSIQEVYDVILGYGAWLESEGFVFDFYNIELSEIIDWKFSGKEFLYWTTQNWAENSVITLSPFADYLKYSYIDSIVDDISGKKYEYSLLKADGRAFPIKNFDLSREDGICLIKTVNTEEGMFFAVLNSVQKEHALVFNNATIFNDTIYDPESGYKQRRIKLSGFRTQSWNGDVFSPGFVYDNVLITDWKQYKPYLPGDVVRYNGSYFSASVRILGDKVFEFSKWVKLSEKPVPDLLPNFDYKIREFEDFYSLDIDNFDYGQQQAAQHLVGYTPRTYLNNIFSNPISQYKFYQGFIKEKGTKNAIDKLSKGTAFNRQGKIELNEEWAFRVGHYGGFDTYKELEFVLEEGSNLENPYVVKFVESLPTDPNPLIKYKTSSDILIAPDNYKSSSTFLTIGGDDVIELTSAGYVRVDDVTATAFSKNSILDIANNDAIQEGSTIWTGFLENGGWTVYRYSNLIPKIVGVYVSSPTEEITFVTDMRHTLSVGDIVSVVKFNDQVNGVYRVTAIPKLTQFSVESELATIVNEDLLSPGLLFKFQPVRFANTEELSNVKNILRFLPNEKVWVDNITTEADTPQWGVFEKIKNYSSGTTFDSYDVSTDQYLGHTIYSKDNQSVLLVSAPGWTLTGAINQGKVWVYETANNVLSKQFEYVLNSNGLKYCSTTTNSEFGFSLSYDKNKKLYFAGAPGASQVVAPSISGTLYSTGTGTSRLYNNEGIVKISTQNESFGQEVSNRVIVNPLVNALAENSRFGQSIYTNNVAANTSTLLIVGAPGSSAYVHTGSVFAYQLTLNTATGKADLSAPVSIYSTSTVALTASSMWGYKISGDNAGNNIAISAPRHFDSVGNKTGVVQIFNKNLSWLQTIVSPFNDGESFGEEVTMSPLGNYLFVSSTRSLTDINSLGKVAVYKKDNTGLYALHQILENPFNTADLNFGFSVSVNENEDILVISALGVNRSVRVEFPIVNQENEEEYTTFDNNTTRFVDPIPDSGTVYLYSKLDDYFIQSDELIDAVILPGSRYGFSVVSNNNSIFVGAPSTTESVAGDDSKFYQFTRLDSSVGSWKLVEYQKDLVDVSKVKRVALIDSLKEEVVEYLDVIDPLKGKIAGIAEQELTYKSASDPAIYTIGNAGVVVDMESNWLDEHVGELWWDLSTVKYVWYEQGDEIYRKNNWGKIFPGASIDVYEWVKSDLLPSEWAAKADTNEGLTKGLSGQPKFGDNSVISVKQVFNNVTGAFENVYYFWVKNKVTVPNIRNRRMSSLTVSAMISDPSAQGLKFAQILSEDAVAFSNVQPMLINDRISANIVADSINNIVPRHTEWLLLEEGNPNSVPNSLLEKKLFDSLRGRDLNGNLVPASNLTYRNRYGIGIRPQQTLFKDRLEALRNLIDFSNSVLLQNKITGNYNFEKLNLKDSIPDEYSGEYDFIVADLDFIPGIETSSFVQAQIECFVSNGKIRAVTILNPGYGYINPPKITVQEISNSGAILKSQIDSQGRLVGVTIENPGNNFLEAPVLKVRPHTVIVQNNSDSNNLWTQHEFDYVLNVWVKVKTQSFDTTKYWKYVDWIGSTFNQFKDYSYVVESPYALNSLDEVAPGDYVKVVNVGDGRFIILEKTKPETLGDFNENYDVVYSEKGTIQITDNLWNSKVNAYTYDSATLEGTLFDETPDTELYNILLALKDDIFVRSLKVNWNLFFFKAVKYALTEQKLLDWAFKTSFINVKSIVDSLDQRAVYKFDNEKFIESYVKEVKPYHSQIRSYTSAFTTLDNSRNSITDFDLPPYFNTVTGEVEVIQLGNSLMDQYPWKSWFDNYKNFVSSVIITNPGEGYTQRPTVVITTATGDTGSGATAEAYLRNGQIYKIELTNPGSGYIIPPNISIVGGGTFVSTTATATPVVYNDKVRKTSMRVKFDRVGLNTEIGEKTVTESFVCDGTRNEFELTWLAEANKPTITPLLDNKLVFSSDYTLEYYTRKYNGYSKKYSSFKFLNTLPKAGQVLTITYNKNIDLYTAVDRIDSLYNPNDNMPGKELPLLMTGAEYPQVNLKGLPFDYTAPWGMDAGYDTTAWGDLVDYYTTSKLVQPVSIGDTSLFLSSVNGIIPGQTLNVLNTPVYTIRTDTVVTSVNTLTNSIEISEHVYEIKSARASSTSTGTTIVVKTMVPFNGAIREGDICIIEGIDTLGFDGQYNVGQIINNNTFEIQAQNTLDNKDALLSFAQVRISSILHPINAEVHTECFINEVTSSEVYIHTKTKFSDVASIVLTLSTGTAQYEVLAEPEIPDQILVRVYDINPIIGNSLRLMLFGYPTVEFWKYDTMFNALDTAIEAGTWDSTPQLVGALGINPEDMLIDGDSFLSANTSYAPEELVPGQVVESVGINVYTKSEQSYPVLISGTFPVEAGETTTVELSVVPVAQIGIMVHFNGELFFRHPTSDFTSYNQYYIEGNVLTIPPQATSGRGGYSIVRAGGTSYIDSNIGVFEIAPGGPYEVQLASLASTDDVRAAYVLVDGTPINETTSTSTYGYMLASVDPLSNNRDSVKIYNLTPGVHTIEAWFFGSPYAAFNRVHEEIFNVPLGSPQSTFVLSIPPVSLQPASAQAIVEKGDADGLGMKRLLPPFVMYYKYTGNPTDQYPVDNKNPKPAGYFSSSNTKVYINGIEIIPGVDFTVVNNNVVISKTMYGGDVIAVMGVVPSDYEYIITDNILNLSTSVEGNRIKVTTFTNHDNMLLRTERFNGNGLNRYVLSRPVINDNYIWVYLNGAPLISRIDFEILDDMVSVQFSEWIKSSPGDNIVITTIDTPEYGGKILGYRIFRDIFDRQDFKRLPRYNTTFLTRNLFLTDTEIHVQDANQLIPPNPQINKPGVILIDRERIEFFEKDGNILRHLRRGTMGTSPCLFADAGTKVIDQTIQQNIPYQEITNVQHIPSSNTTTYVISTVSTTATSNGIVLNPLVPAVDQIHVYYGGRMLRKTSLEVHNRNKAFDTTSTSIDVLPPEFTINTSTQELVLALDEFITTGTRITVVQKLGSIWTGTESLLTSDVIQARFLRAKEAELPTSYYYGGDPTLTSEGFIPIVLDDGTPLEGYA